MRVRAHLDLIFVVWLGMFAVSPPWALAETQHADTENQVAFLLWRQGYLLHVAGEYEQAIEYFSKSIDLHPTAEGFTYRGWSLSMLGRLEEAIDECKQAIELDPEYGNPYNDIGVYLIDLGQTENALPWLRKATQAKRYCCYQYPHFNIGRVLLSKGRLAEAIYAFERALSYQPDYSPALEALEFIRRRQLDAT